MKRFAILCRRCRRQVDEADTPKAAHEAAFRHTLHGNDDVLILDREAKPKKIDLQTRTGMPVHRRVRGEEPGGDLAAALLAPRPTRRPYAVVCVGCQALLAEEAHEEDGFKAARRHPEHSDRQVLVIFRLVDVGDRHVVDRAGRLVAIRRDGDPDGGEWQGLIDAGIQGELSA